jgi:hypothetical protein
MPRKYCHPQGAISTATVLWRDKQSAATGFMVFSQCSRSDDRQLWQLDYFTEGSIPDALIGVPEGWTPDQIKQFQDYWDTEFAGDLAKRRRAKFVPGESAAKVVQTKEPQHKDDFDGWLARIICFAFSVPPTAIANARVQG